MHNYSNLSKEKNEILINVGIISGIISSFINLLLSKYLDTGFFVRTGLVAVALYFLINNFFWKLKIFELIFKIPNLNGVYLVRAHNTKKDISWEGVITIEQTLDKISIHLDGPTSDSDSEMASIKYLNKRGYQLEYSYKNKRPGQDCAELRPHDGKSTLIFDKDIQTAQGEYYTNIKDRESFGTMNITRKNKGQEALECAR